MIDRRGFLRLFASSTIIASTNPVHFLAPVGGWRKTYSFKDCTAGTFPMIGYEYRNISVNLYNIDKMWFIRHYEESDNEFRERITRSLTR